jgi:hypothetical protein
VVRVYRRLIDMLGVRQIGLSARKRYGQFAGRIHIAEQNRAFGRTATPIPRSLREDCCY